VRVVRTLRPGFYVKFPLHDLLPGDERFFASLGEARNYAYSMIHAILIESEDHLSLSFDVRISLVDRSGVETLQEMHVIGIERHLALRAKAVGR
jgi:hypothetical protein